MPPNKDHKSAAGSVLVTTKASSLMAAGSAIGVSVLFLGGF